MYVIIKELKERILLWWDINISYCQISELNTDILSQFLNYNPITLLNFSNVDYLDATTDFNSFC